MAARASAGLPARGRSTMTRIEAQGTEPRYVPPPGFVNVDQAEGWDGEEGDHWVAFEEHYNASVRRYTRRLLAAAQVAVDAQVLDLGCGCGESTREAARRAPAGMALGVDLSARMIARARERSRAEG